jgi:acyl carrier protein
MQNCESVMEEIRPIIAEVLAVEPEEVKAESRFFEDLGGESIDMLELTFQLEKRYGTSIPLQKLATSDDLGTDETGHLTPSALDHLKTNFPFLDYSGFEQDPLKTRITEMFTVEALARCVVAMLGGKSAVV